MKSFCSLFVSLLLFTSSTFAELKIPPLSGPVIDDAALLTREENRELDRLLRSFPPALQMQIWTVSSLENEPIESLSIRAADQWKLGTAKNDNGIILIVALQDRAMRIEVGQGLEGDIPDALAGRIIDNILKPNFRENRFYDGLRAAALSIYQTVKGEPANIPEDVPQKDLPLPFGIFPFLIFFIIFLIIQIFKVRRGGPGSPWGGGGFYGGGFGGGGWSGGGGGWSGGGGGFSGGGSSGRW